MTQESDARIIVYASTDLPGIKERALALKDALQNVELVLETSASRADPNGRTIRFLKALNGTTAARPDDADIVVRLDAAAAKLDSVSQLITKRFAYQLLSPRYLEQARAIMNSPQGSRIGVAFQPGLPRIRLDHASDPTLITRLAVQLSLSEESFTETCFFPQPLCLMRGALYNALTQRHGQASLAEDQALALGFHALCKTSGLDTAELSPKPEAADLGALRNLLTEKYAQASGTGRHPEYRPHSVRNDLPQEPVLKYIAYYLPQFHAIPENDAWWGAGFTEWTNVTKAAPRFVGHEQPKLPADLGFYDLSTPATMARQIELARAHGIHGFCFYYYWFNGRTLLETPLTNLLADPSLDIPFCLCWANENWTRRWDGQENEVLMEQSHSARDDLNFIQHIAPYLRDTRYIRIDGKPLLLVYRATLLADAKATAQRWRAWCRDNGIGEICIAAVRSFEIEDPRPFGFDLAIDFPPHRLRNAPPITPSLTLLDEAFSGEVLDYRDTAMLAALGLSSEQPPEFPVLRGVMAGWDNDARRNGRGRVFHHASPSAYASWLRITSTHTLRHNPPHLRYVFINAWNEWAEGAYLEPDRRFGHGYLAATADTLRLFDDSPKAPAPELGSSSAALAHAPEHLLRRHGPTESALCRARIESAGGAPSIRVLLMAEQFTPAVLDSLQSLAEQTLRPFAVSLLTLAKEPVQSWLDHAGIEFEVIVTESVVDAALHAAKSHDEDWLILLNAGDRLFPHALLTIAAHLCVQPNTRVLLCDELEKSADGQTNDLKLRTLPTLTSLLSGRRSGGLLGVRREHFAAQGGLDAASLGALETDYLLRTVRTGGWSDIGHLPEVLVWRSLEQHPDMALPQAGRAAAHVAVAAAHLKHLGLTADVVPLEGEVFRVVPQRARTPKVSILILSHNQADALQRCVEGIFSSTTHADYEVIVVDNDNTEPQAHSFIDGLAQLDPQRIRVLPVSGAFEHSRFVNAAAREARGDFLLLLDDDVTPLHPEWLDALLDEAAADDVGVVGARLLFPDGRLQHAGVMPGLSGVADFPWLGSPLNAAGPDGILLHSHEVPAVSGSCMLLRTSLFNELGGFDEAFRAGFGDFDLCLRAASLGARVVWTPHAALMHETGRSLKAAVDVPEVAGQLQQAFDAGRKLFSTRWHNAMAHNPYLNANLSLHSRNLQVESTPALARDPLDWHPLPRVLALPADAAGSGHYRVVQPARAAHDSTQSRSRIANAYPHPLQFERLGIDTLHTQRQVDDAQLKALAALRQTTSLRIVMDFDDLLTEVPKHSYHHGTVWPDIERRIAESCRLVDCVTASTEPLAQRLRAWHDDVRVVQNGIDPALWRNLPEVPRNGSKLRVGWAGGVSHAGDLAQIRAVVAELADEVEWVFFGMCLEEIQPHLHEFHRGVPFDAYPAKLASLGLDLAIAPLEANAFNDCKSNLRLLEYGALGIPVIASDAVPYRCGLPVTLLENATQKWVSAIRERIGERDALREEGARLRQAVLQDWTQESMLPGWISAWTK